jgi:hypothetical protein
MELLFVEMGQAELCIYSSQWFRLIYFFEWHAILLLTTEMLKRVSK